MYYIVETKYVGPNPHDHRFVDADRIEISTSPAYTNSSHEKCTEGWCGTTNDWSIHAHGEYETIEEARDAITQIFGEVRDSDLNGHSFESDDTDVLEVYKQGRYEPMSRDATADWTYEGIMLDITAETTDERICQLVDEYEKEANAQGYTLHSDLEIFMEQRRQELQESLSETL